MTAEEYISDTEEIVKASLSLFQHDGVTALTLSERSQLQPALSAKNLPGGWTWILIVSRISRIYNHPGENDEDSAHECIADTDIWLDLDGDQNNPDHSVDDCAVDVESEIEHNNENEDSESTAQQHVSATLNISELSWPTSKLDREGENVLLTVNVMKTWRNTGIKKKYDKMRQCFTCLVL